MSDVVCSACGHHNPLGSNFCSSCGGALDDRGTDHTTMSFPVDDINAGDQAIDEMGLAPGTGILLVRRGPKAGSRYLLDASCTTLGRHPESAIFLDDITVSRRHAEIRRGPEGYRVVDVGSLNGTYLNRERIDDEALTDGDLLQVGKFKLMYVANDGAEQGE
ncbi:MAG: FHA domain-containing protein [Acidimicrobiia bacterium]|nr:FHA domain-containing protein [Acidimicrobiia bacterium]